jgi:hypothetical protein
MMGGYTSGFFLQSFSPRRWTPGMPRLRAAAIQYLGQFAYEPQSKSALGKSWSGRYPEFSETLVRKASRSTRFEPARLPLPVPTKEEKTIWMAEPYFSSS